MPENIRYEDDDLFNPETQHEHSDVPVRPLWLAIILFVLFAIITHFVIWFMYKGFVAAENRRAEAPQTAIGLPPDHGVPRNQPLLQPFPAAGEQSAPPYQSKPATDLVQLRRGEEAILRNYGWVDQQKGIVRIPIDRAKEMLVTRVALSAAGVPTASEELIPPQTPQPAETTATDSAPAPTGTVQQNPEGAPQ